MSAMDSLLAAPLHAGTLSSATSSHTASPVRSHMVRPVNGDTCDEVIAEDAARTRETRTLTASMAEGAPHVD